MERASRTFLKQQPNSSRILSQLCHQIFELPSNLEEDKDIFYLIVLF